jgi:hypothetical protein
MQRHALFAAMLAAGLLAACGGGGSGGGDTSGGTPTPVVTTTTVALSGVAAKGVMAGAIVTAHAIKADGSIDPTPLATSSPTAADGSYTLNFKTEKGQPYVLKVTATASTTHVDEVKGVQPLPAGFEMRTVLVASSNDTSVASASITPFTEMEVAAAAKSSGGITATNVAQAATAVQQLLGFDPAAVAVKAADAATATADEKKLAVMLTAVAQLADSGALGCASGTSGDKTQCVVQALANSASASSIKLESGSGDAKVDVSAALSQAVTTVLTTPELAKGVDSALLTTVVANLGCTDATACQAASSGSGSTTPAEPSALALAIASAKLLFAELKTDWGTLFSRGGAAAGVQGAANAEAYKFSQAMTGVQVPAEMALKDVGAIVSCIDMYNDYKAGRTTDSFNGSFFNTPTRGSAYGSTASDGSLDVNFFNGTGCTLFQDAAATITATSPANANYIGISSNFYVTRSVDAATGVTTTTRWRHGFTLAPVAGTAGSFTYTNRARMTAQTCTPNGSGGSTCSTSTNLILQKNADGTDRPAFAGTVATTTNADGSIVDFSLQGQLAASFLRNSNTLSSEDHHDVNVSGTRTINGASDESASVQGSVVAVAADGSTVSTLTVKSGTARQVPMGFDANWNRVSMASPAVVNGPAGGELAELSLNVLFSNANAEFEGVLEATDTVWDKSLTSHSPTKAKLAGMLRNGSGASATEFLSGSFTASASGTAGYDSTLPAGPDNFFTVGVSFVGKATAPNRPVLEFTVGGSKKSFASDLDTLSMQYRSLVGGTVKRVVNVSTSRNADSSFNLTLAEANTGLSLAWLNGATAGELKKGDLAVGVLSRADKRLTFADGSFISLDLGL